MSSEYGENKDRRIMFGIFVRDDESVGTRTTDGTVVDTKTVPRYRKGEGYLAFIGEDNKEIQGSRRLITRAEVTAIKSVGKIEKSDRLLGDSEIRRSFTASCPNALDKPFVDLESFANAVPDPADKIPAFPNAQVKSCLQPNSQPELELSKRFTSVGLGALPIDNGPMIFDDDIFKR